MSPHRPGSEPAAVTIALPVVERLTRTVAAETEDIRAGRPAPYELYGQRKNQSLLELNRLMPALARGGGARLREALAELNAELAQQIADGSATLETPGLADHLWATTLAKLAVDQPQYGSYRREIARETRQ